MNLSEEGQKRIKISRKNKEQRSYVSSFIYLLFTDCGLHCVSLLMLQVSTDQSQTQC